MIEGEYIKAEYTQGITYPIALIFRSRRLQVVRPSFKILGSSGYERWYYPINIDVLLYLKSLLSVGRLVILPRCLLDRWMCKIVRKAAEKAWVEEGKSEHEVEAALESLTI